MIPAERRWRVLIVVSVAVFMASLDLFIVNLAFPSIERDFPGTDVATISWVLNAYAIVFAALLVPAGRLADRYGHKRGFVAGLLLFLLGSTLCGVAPSVDTLIAARVLQATGAALLMPTSLALLLPEFPPAQRAAAIGAWAGVGAVAAAAGPVLGGVLVEASWRLVFLVNIPVGLVALVFSLRLLREQRDATRARPDLLGTALLTASIAVLALGLVKTPDWGWIDGRTVAALVGSATGLALFWIRCHHHPTPVIDPAMLRVRSFAMANLATLLFSVGFAAMLLTNVLFMTDVWGDSVLVAGLSLSPGPLLAATFAFQAGHLVRRAGQRVLAMAGLTLFACGGAWWLWRVGPHAAYWTELFPGQLMTGTGVGLALPSLSSAAAASLPPARFATGSAVLTMSRQLGSVLGVAIVVALLASPDASDPVASFRHCWLMIAVASLLGLAAARAIGTIHQHTTAPAPPETAAAPVVVGSGVG